MGKYQDKLDKMMLARKDETLALAKELGINIPSMEKMRKLCSRGQTNVSDELILLRYITGHINNLKR
ncbi:hypothetical protein [uncultured Brachyspira sp.]|uniref:hypothetical protein n=1 Tax=uncultured Brachyspira sp. TaxID=221953 RepID=UPI002583C9A5|nr:hypothetical protein [uncultured Brachyspira sp.]